MIVRRNVRWGAMNKGDDGIMMNATVIVLVWKNANVVITLVWDFLFPV